MSKIILFYSRFKNDFLYYKYALVKIIGNCVMVFKYTFFKLYNVLGNSYKTSICLSLLICINCSIYSNYIFFIILSFNVSPLTRNVIILFYLEICFCKNFNCSIKLMPTTFIKL